jgi:transposase
LHGVTGLQTITKNTYYSLELKQQAITDYLNGEGSLFDICNKYDISAHGILHQWIKKYNGHEGLKSHNAQGDRFMIKGRKTTYEERVEIVAFCVANSDNYQLTIENFQVSYQQVYTWVQKYRTNGYEALSDKRGKRKTAEELTETEKVAAQLKLLEAENRRLKMENDFLKKLDMVERRREKVEHIKKINT